jgi:hypothetical protein
MAIHGFVLEEDTKPAHERHMQALKVPWQAFHWYRITHSFPLSYYIQHGQ